MLSYENVMWNNVRTLTCQDRWRLLVHHLLKNCYSVTKGYGTGITQFLLDKFVLATTHLPTILQVLTVHLIYLLQLFGVFLRHLNYADGSVIPQLFLPLLYKGRHRVSSSWIFWNFLHSSKWRTANGSWEGFI